MRPPTLKPRDAGRGFAHALPVPSWTHDHIPTRTLRGETGGAGSQFGRCDNFTSIAASRADWYSA